MRDISKGEPITWSYAGMNSDFLNSSYEVRGQILFDKFFFACRCERCQAEMPEQVADNKVRLEQYWKDFRNSISA